MGIIRDDLHVSGRLSADEIVPPNTPWSGKGVRHEISRSIALPSTVRVKKTVQSRWFDLDNGSGTTIDDVVLRSASAITITAARILYVDATSGTVAAGSAKIGTTVGGAEIAAATNYENAKAVGTATAITLTTAAGVAVAANTPVIVRHTGVAATQAGQAVVEIDYYELSDAGEVYSATIPLEITPAGSTLLAVEASCATAPTGGDKAFTIDLQRGSQADAFATVLSAAITIDSTIDDREVVEGTIADAACSAGEQLRLVIATSGSTGTQGAGLVVTVSYERAPLTT